MRRSPRQRAFWRLNWVGPFALAGLCHAYLLASLIAPLTSIAQAAPPAAAAATDALPPDAIDPSCTGDALLAAAAAAIACESPLADRDCESATQAALAADLAHCRGDDAPLEFAMLDPAQMAKLTPIDPEPLLDSITPEAEAQFQAQQQAEQVAIAEEAEKQKQLPPENAQVVETARPALEIEPDQARFVSEYNTKVAQETVARGAVREKMTEKPAAAELPIRTNAPDPTSPKPPTDRPPSMAENAPDAPGKLSMRAPGAIAPSETAQEQKVRGAADGKVGPAGDGTAIRRGDGAIEQGRRDPRQLDPGQGGGGGGAPHVPTLRPTDEQLSRVVGGGSVDHYDDVEEGEVTAVNSKQWIGADFMNRTKRLVAQEWNPADVWARFDPNGSVYGFKTRVTVLRVTLTPDGALAKTMVVRGSGVDFLDDEAIRAFKAAGPFPNPPGVLRGDDGMISFTFGFYFEINGGHSSWKVFRQM